MKIDRIRSIEPVEMLLICLDGTKGHGSGDSWDQRLGTYWSLTGTLKSCLWMEGSSESLQSSKVWSCLLILSNYYHLLYITTETSNSWQGMRLKATTFIRYIRRTIQNLQNIKHSEWIWFFPLETQITFSWKGDENPKIWL